ncbi:MAG: hypothetical protein ABI443_02150, partial [Chthoniobacterales bacterium]
MNDAQWNELAENLRSRNLSVPASCPDSDPIAAIAHLNHHDSDSALEWMAGQFEMIPLHLTRAACSTQAEEIFRRLAYEKTSEEPWLPFGTLGPLVLFAHYNPITIDYWGIPKNFIICALVTESQYRELHGDFTDRFNFNPLVPPTAPLEVEPPPVGEGLLTMTQWFLRNYPLTEKEREALTDSERAFNGNDYRRISDFKLLPKNYGIAFNHISKNEPSFAPDYAPSQTVFPDTLLEKHGVYPLYCGKKQVYLLVAERDNFAFEDEWLSTGSEEFHFTKLLADRTSIFEAIARTRGRGVQAAKEVVTGELNYSDTTNLVEIDAAEMQGLNPASIHVTPEQIIH